MDATPLTVGQEFSGYVAQLDGAMSELRLYYRPYMNWHWVEPLLGLVKYP